MVLICSALFASTALCQSHETEVYLFWQRGCVHCEDAVNYVTRLEARDTSVRVHYLELRGADNRAFYRAALEHLELTRLAVPLTVIDTTAIVGYLDDASTGREIDELIAGCARSACVNTLAELAADMPTSDDRALALAAIDASPATPNPAPAAGSAAGGAVRVRLPWLGEVDPQSLSLPVLTVVLASVDGFNPCAMWVLIFLVGLLLGLQDPVRRWMLGGIFLLTTALVYYGVIAAWLNVLLVLGLVAWLRIVVGVGAVAGGAYYAYQYFQSGEALCRVASAAERQSVTARLRAAALEPRFFAAAAAIAMLAVGVNFVELLCSAGIPAVYTQVLVLTPMPAWQHHLWLALYVLVFLADDVAIFVAAMLTLKVTGGAGRYAHHAQLVGGVVLLVVGALLIGRPEWLRFG
jgi:hypothetical protein